MGSYFTRERFGRPQFLAALILLAFLAQALWLVHVELSSAQSMDGEEALRIGEGLKQWHGRGIASAPLSDPLDDPFIHLSQSSENGFDREHSPLLSLVSAAPLLVWPSHLNAESATYWRWLPKLPFLACGLFLGASLWYVARRLCGNTGGFIALTLYAFSPSLIQAAAVWQTEPEIVAAWGAFGTIFTAIAVAHTLYAPREVVLWNWRRIVLLGVSLAIAIGSQFSMMVVVPMALIFLLYVAPVRRRAGLVIWIAACVVGLIVLRKEDAYRHVEPERSGGQAAPADPVDRGLQFPAPIVASRSSRRGNPARSSVPRLCDNPARRSDNLLPLAAVTVLWEYSAVACGCPFCGPGNGYSAHRRSRISARRNSIFVYFCFRGTG